MDGCTSRQQPTPTIARPPTCAQGFYMQSDTRCKCTVTFCPLVKISSHSECIKYNTRAEKQTAVTWITFTFYLNIEQ